MTPKSVHRMGTTALSLAMAVIGLVLIVQVASGGGRGVIVRLVLGVLFLAAGSGRMYLAHKSRRA